MYVQRFSTRCLWVSLIRTNEQMNKQPDRMEYNRIRTFNRLQARSNEKIEQMHLKIMLNGDIKIYSTPTVLTCFVCTQFAFTDTDAMKM